MSSASDQTASAFGDELLGKRRSPRPPFLTLGLVVLLCLVVGFIAGAMVEQSSEASAPAFPARMGPPVGGGPGAAPQAGDQDSAQYLGTIRMAEGERIYIQGPEGDEQRVELGRSSAVRVLSDGSAKQLRPGQTVMVSGTRQPDGTVEATSVTETPVGGSG